MTDKSFVRWQGYTLQQFSYANNLFLISSIASLGFIIDFMRDLDFSLSYSNKQLIVCSLLFLLISISSGCFATVSRLQDFRITARIARDRDNNDNSEELDSLRSTANLLGKTTWRLFWTQLTSFLMGILFVVYPAYEAFIK